MDGEDESLGLLCRQQCTLGGWQDNTGSFGVDRVVLLVNGWIWMFSESVWVNAPVLPKCIEAAAYFDFASGAAEMGRNIHLHSCPYWFIWPFAFEWRSYAWQWKYKSTFCVRMKIKPCSALHTAESSWHFIWKLVTVNNCRQYLVVGDGSHPMMRFCPFKTAVFVNWRNSHDFLA